MWDDQERVSTIVMRKHKNTEIAKRIKLASGSKLGGVAMEIQGIIEDMLEYNVLLAMCCNIEICSGNMFVDCGLGSNTDCRIPRTDLLIAVK